MGCGVFMCLSRQNGTSDSFHEEKKKKKLTKEHTGHFRSIDEYLILSWVVGSGVFVLLCLPMSIVVGNILLFTPNLTSF